MTSRKTDLQALRNIIAEANLILSTTELPEGRATRARELLTAALALNDALLTSPVPRTAAALGKKGGRKTAERGPDYFSKIAAMRKKRAGGRPRREP